MRSGVEQDEHSPVSFTTARERGMGLFKGMKDLKDLGDHHGGMPSMRGAMKDIGKLADDRGAKEILATGTAAKAIVKGFLTPVPGDNFTMALPLEIHPPGGTPYEINHLVPSARMKTPLSMGMEIPIKIHPQDPSQVAVQWDALQGAIAAQGGDMAAVMGGLQQTRATDANAAMAASMGIAPGAPVFAQPAAAPADPAERMRKITELRDQGILTDAEFEAKRAEIIAEM